MKLKKKFCSLFIYLSISVITSLLIFYRISSFPRHGSCQISGFKKAEIKFRGSIRILKSDPNLLAVIEFLFCSDPITKLPTHRQRSRKNTRPRLISVIRWVFSSTSCKSCFFCFFFFFFEERKINFLFLLLTFTCKIKFRNFF